jgi:hypothetical protein
MTNLSNAQLLAIKNWINANNTANGSGLFDQSSVNLLNAAAAGPNNVCWKSSVPTAAVGKTVDYVAVEAMTDANRTRVTTFYTMNPTSFEPRSDVRTFWENTFSGALGGQGQATRDALLALWKRTMTVGESILKTGVGSDASPATLGVTTAADGTTGYAEGPVTLQNVIESVSAA